MKRTPLRKPLRRSLPKPAVPLNHHAEAHPAARRRTRRRPVNRR